MCLIGCESDEVWLPTCVTVVRAANAVATPNAAANAANAMRRRMTCSDVKRLDTALLGGSRGDERRDFAVEPVLLVGQGFPRLRHPRVAPEGRLAFRTFRKLQAIFRVFSQ